jgi:hypothetical protein
MVDFEHLSEWPIDKIVNARGFQCEKCGAREAISFTTSSLEEAMRKLKRFPSDSRQYHYHLYRCIRKAEGLQQRGERNGTQQRKNMASSRSLG